MTYQLSIIVGPMSGYTFYSEAGDQARLSNSCRTAERHLASAEFQNAVVMSSRPLDDDMPFQVVIEKKVRTWSGSIIIGEPRACTSYVEGLASETKRYYESFV